MSRFKLFLGASGAPAASGVTAESVKALPLSAFAVAAVTVAAATSKALPLSGSATAAVSVQATTSKALGLGGSATGAVAVAGASSRRLPLAGTAAAVAAVAGASARALPLAGAVVASVPVLATTTGALPLGGSATMVVGTISFFESVKALPLAGTAAGVVPVAAASSKALPLAGTAAAVVAVVGASAKALPLGGAVTAAVPVVAASARALPLGGSATMSVASFFESVRALPLAGTAAGVVPVAATSTRALPIGGSVVATMPVTAESAKSLPLGGTVTAATSARLASSVAALPLAGMASFSVPRSGGLNYQQIQRAVRARLATLVAATSGSIDMGTTTTSFTRAAGSFLADGFRAGVEIVTSGFVNPANNGTFYVIGVSAAALRVSTTLVAEVAAAGRLALAGLPSMAYENEPVTPVTGVPYVEEQFVPGPVHRTTPGTAAYPATLELTPLYTVLFNIPAEGGADAADVYADALLRLFKAHTTMTLANGDVLRVRGDPAPYPGQMIPRKTGWATVPVTIPLRMTTINS